MPLSTHDQSRKRSPNFEIRGRKISCKRSSESSQPYHQTTQGGESVGIWDIRERLQENFRRVEAILDSIDAESHPDAKVRAAAEIRHHIALVHKTQESASRVEAVRHFMNTVLRILEETGAPIRKRIIDKLNHRLKLLDQEARQADPESSPSS